MSTFMERLNARPLNVGDQVVIGGGTGPTYGDTRFTVVDVEPTHATIEAPQGYVMPDGHASPMRVARWAIDRVAE